MKTLKNKTAIITGGGSGVGLETARLFLAEGARVLLFDLNQESLDAARSSLGARDDSLATVQGDVTSDADIAKAVDVAKSRFDRLDILVNSAGRLHFGRLEQADPQDWDRVMRTNVFGAWRFMVAARPSMIEAGGGAIVNVSSINSIKAFPEAGLYCASKAALNMISQVMAMENAEAGIRVNLVAPGTIEDTGFIRPTVQSDEDLQRFYRKLAGTHPLGRNARAIDVARAILYLASDQSSFVTGTLLNVDGGRHLATNRPPSSIPE